MRLTGLEGRKKYEEAITELRARMVKLSEEEATRMAQEAASKRYQDLISDQESVFEELGVRVFLPFYETSPTLPPLRQ